MIKDLHFDSFFTPASKIDGNQIIIDGNEFRHLHKVKRKRAGDKIHATDGEGNYYTVQLVKIKATQAIAEIIKTQHLILILSKPSFQRAQVSIKSQTGTFMIITP